MSNEIRILLVEDNEGDIVLTKEAFKEASFPHSIDVIQDGEEVLPFLKKEGKYKEAQSPDIIFLDINLPKVRGTELLEQIKTSDDLKRTPVIMLTTSDSKKDIDACYNNYANCYITKPLDIEQFMEVIQTLKKFWTGIAKLPNK